MNPKTIILPIFLILQSCGDFFSRQDTDNSAYFSDALACHHSSTLKEQIKVPTAGAMGAMAVIEIPVTNAPGIFGDCMKNKGHIVEKANPETYLKTSRDCLQAARHAENPSDAYAYCVRRGGISVDLLPKDKANGQ